jgi:very-short-patch-repair endonuclease
MDLATTLPRKQLDAALNEADKHNLISPPELLKALERLPNHPGVLRLRTKLQTDTFTLTDSELERIFLRLVRGIGLPLPRTGVYVNELKVDFFWPEIGLVVETDGLRYHRTASQQRQDRYRDQIHFSRGLTPLRFTYYQVRFEPGRVSEILTGAFERLGALSQGGRG